MSANFQDSLTSQTISQTSENERRTESDRQIRKLAADLKRTPMNNGPRNNLFLIGAGTSVSAKIPAARDIAKLLILREHNDRYGGITNIKDLFPSLPDADKAYEKLISDQVMRGRSPVQSTSQTVDWSSLYDECFETFCTDSQDVRELFSQLVEYADGAINWSHLVLGELVKEKYCQTVLTTNFDQLVMKGMVMAGVIPVVCDGLESLNRVQSRPKHPQLVELHGSRHSYTLRNRAEDVAELRGKNEVIGAINGLIQGAQNIVVVGYGAREPGFMDVFIDAAENYPNKHIYWISYDASADMLSERASKFCNTSRNKEVICGQDADVFFLKLAQAMGVGIPSVIRQPLEVMKRWVGDTQKVQISDPDIQSEVEMGGRVIDELEDCHRRKSQRASKTVGSETLRALRLSGETDKAIETASQQTSPAPALLAEVAFAAYDKANATHKIEDHFEAIKALYIALKNVEDDSTKERIRDLLRATGPELAVTAERLTGLDDLRQTIDDYRHRFEPDTLDEVPFVQAMTENNLGNLFRVLGKRRDGQDGIDALTQAEAAHRRALEVYTRTDFPIDWAMTQNNLGNVLQILGARRVGQDSIDALIGAEAAYRRALEVRSRADFPVQWAATQNNLGSVLSILGERRRGQDGMDALTDAEAAYRRALEVCTRADFPTQWAMTQNNLGIVLQTLGERRDGQDGMDTLTQAEAAYRQALEVRSRADFPIDWAMTQTNLGNVLQTLGQRRDGPDGMDALNKAEAAYRHALEVYTRTDFPIDWAMAQNNLGGVLLTLGQRRDGPDGMDALTGAEAAYRAALEVRTRTDFPVNWAMTQENLGILCQSLYDKTGDHPSLLRGIEAVEGALEVYRSIQSEYYINKAEALLSHLRARAAN